MNLFKSIIKKTVGMTGYNLIPKWKTVDENTFHSDCQKFLPTHSQLTILDIGASIGDFSLGVAQQYPQATIFAFEPQHQVFAELVAKTKHLSAIRPVNLALGDKTGKTNMYVTQNHASSSLLKSNECYYTEQTVVGQEMVDTMTLVEWASKEEIQVIDLLKLDTQGYELTVLRHAGDYLKKTTLIYSEVHFHTQYEGSTNFFELSLFLSENGFKFFNLYNIRRINQQAIFSDALYINESMVNRKEEL